MKRRILLCALACTAVLLAAGTTHAAGRGPGTPSWSLSDPSWEWSQDKVSVTGSIVCNGTALALGALVNTFGLTDIVIGNLGAAAAVVTLVDSSSLPRLTAIVGPNSTFTDSFKVALILAAGPISINCTTGSTVYVTVSGRSAELED